MVMQNVLRGERCIIGGYVKIREENLADLTFAKTSGTITTERGNKRPFRPQFPSRRTQKPKSKTSKPLSNFFVVPHIGKKWSHT